MYTSNARVLSVQEVRPKQSDMWLYFDIKFHDGVEMFIRYFCLWIPSTNSLGSIRLGIVLRLNPENQAVTGELGIKLRRSTEHWSDDEPDVV